MMGINLFFFIIPDRYQGDLISDYKFQWGYYIAILEWFGFCIITLILIKSKFGKANESVKLIKKAVLELGTQYANLEIREISEACSINRIMVIDIVKTMIANREIYAEYFISSQSVAFNKQTNIEEIDQLMAKFRDWEGELEKKI